MSLIILKQNEKINTAREKMNKLAAGRGLDAKKYCGKVKLKEDPVNYQKRIRNEWH